MSNDQETNVLDHPLKDLLDKLFAHFPVRILHRVDVDAALRAWRRPQETTCHEYIVQASKLSGCAWRCYVKDRADGEGGGFDKCCSSCQNIAQALAAAANRELRPITQDAGRRPTHEEQLENRKVPLTGSEIDEIKRRLALLSDPNDRMTKAWAIVAIEQLATSCPTPQEPKP
jgi:hypothetical protein